MTVPDVSSPPMRKACGWSITVTWAFSGVLIGRHSEVLRCSATHTDLCIVRYLYRRIYTDTLGNNTLHTALFSQREGESLKLWGIFVNLLSGLDRQPDRFSGCQPAELDFQFAGEEWSYCVNSLLLTAVNSNATLQLLQVRFLKVIHGGYICK